ncbi:hypothetical protein ACN47E_002475 [Coniothyrium glycines]
MATISAGTTSRATQPPNPAFGEFRLGDTPTSGADDASDSEDDQSAASEHDILSGNAAQNLEAPTITTTKATWTVKSTKSSRRRKNKKDRHEVGALQENLDIVLDNAFATPHADNLTSNVVESTHAPIDVEMPMEFDALDTGKKLNKRTRQNMAKMLARKQNANGQQIHQQLTEQDQAAAAARRGLTLEDYRKQRKQGSSGTKHERRIKKQKQRARKVEEETNRMDIG